MHLVQQQSPLISLNVWLCPHLLPVPNHLPQSNTDSQGPPTLFWESTISTRYLCFYLITVYSAFPCISLGSACYVAAKCMQIKEQSLPEPRQMCEYIMQIFVKAKLYNLWNKVRFSILLSLTIMSCRQCPATKLTCMRENAQTHSFCHETHQQLIIYTECATVFALVLSCQGQTGTDPVSRG